MIIQIFNWSLPFGKAINTCLIKTVEPKGSSPVMADIREFEMEAGICTSHLSWFHGVITSSASLYMVTLYVHQVEPTCNISYWSKGDYRTLRREKKITALTAGCEENNVLKQIHRWATCSPKEMAEQEGSVVSSSAFSGFFFSYLRGCWSRVQTVRN